MATVMVDFNPAKSTEILPRKFSPFLDGNELLTIHRVEVSQNAENLAVFSCKVHWLSRDV
jgi:hypothetical protein